MGGRLVEEQPNPTDWEVPPKCVSLDFRQGLPDLPSIAELTAKCSVKKRSSNGKCWNCCVGLENVALVCEHYWISRPHATRKPKDWPVRRPGDLVQVDTVDLRRHLQE